MKQGKKNIFFPTKVCLLCNEDCHKCLKRKLIASLGLDNYTLHYLLTSQNWICYHRRIFIYIIPFLSFLLLSLYHMVFMKKTIITNLEIYPFPQNIKCHINLCFNLCKLIIMHFKDNTCTSQYRS